MPAPRPLPEFALAAITWRLGPRQESHWRIEAEEISYEWVGTRE